VHPDADPGLGTRAQAAVDDACAVEGGVVVVKLRYFINH